MKRRSLLASIPAAMGLAGCLSRGSLLDQGGQTSTKHVGIAYGEVSVSSPAFQFNDPLPPEYTCNSGGQISPPLEYTNKNAAQNPNRHDKAKSWAVHVHSVPYQTPQNQSSSTTHPQPITHWLIWNIPGGQDLPKGVPHGKSISSLNQANQGKNSFGDYGYDLGCPISERRALSFDVFTLNDYLDAGANISPKELVDKIYGTPQTTSLRAVGGTQAIIGPSTQN